MQNAKHQCRTLRVRFFKKIQDWIPKWILGRSVQDLSDHDASKEPKNLSLDPLFPLMHHDPKDLVLICLEKKPKIHFRILSDSRLQSLIFLKKRTLNWEIFCCDNLQNGLSWSRDANYECNVNVADIRSPLENIYCLHDTHEGFHTNARNNVLQL